MIILFDFDMNTSFDRGSRKFFFFANAKCYPDKIFGTIIPGWSIGTCVYSMFHAYNTHTYVLIHLYVIHRNIHFLTNLFLWFLTTVKLKKPSFFVLKTIHSISVKSQKSQETLNPSTPWYHKYLVCKVCIAHWPQVTTIKLIL